MPLQGLAWKLTNCVIFKKTVLSEDQFGSKQSVVFSLRLHLQRVNLKRNLSGRRDQFGNEQE